MKRFAAAAFGAAALLVPQSVIAQDLMPGAATTQDSSQGSSSSSSSKSSSKTSFWSWLRSDSFAGGGAGVVITKRTGGQVYGEAGKTNVWQHLDFSIEAGWMSSAVNQFRIDSAGAIAHSLSQSQGLPASATVKVHAGYGVFNARRTFYSKPKYSVYALGGVGFASTSAKTTFTLGGTDVSGSVGQYGVTLGKDLAGSSTSALLNIGVGATTPLDKWFASKLFGGKWFGDASYRLTPIFTGNQSTVVSRFNFGVTRHF